MRMYSSIREIVGLTIQGALMEIGPFRVKGDRLVENEGSWHEFANLLFGMERLV